MLRLPHMPHSLSHTCHTPQNAIGCQVERLDLQLQSKEAAIGALEAERAALLSAQSGRARTPPTPSEQRTAREEAQRLREVEIRLAAEAKAAAAMEEQRRQLEQERKAMAEERARSAVRSKAAMDEQISRTMRMFQAQLAQTVKMAAMLQAQRIINGGVGADMPAAPPKVRMWAAPPKVHMRAAL
eukprot:365514-Chlamydomonas_euryale.AAC.1